MSEPPEVQLAQGGRAVLVAPAGYGKTEVIARAVGLSQQDRQLVLTHTHAGVRALRDRLRKLNISPRHFFINTIAGWALNYAQAYPKLSGLSIPVPPDDQDWPLVYQVAMQLLSHPPIRKVINESYKGLYVDEYQDCTRPQHRLILALAELLPCRVVGDPLQGIFDFHEPVVDWNKDVFSEFTQLDDLTEPWRWKSVRPDLGHWLEGVRASLLAGQPINFEHESLQWIRLTPEQQRTVCYRAARLTGTVVGIHRLPPQAHQLASRLKGSFTSIDEVYCKELFSFAKRLDETSGFERAGCVIQFASKCMTKVSSELKSLQKMCVKGEIYPQRVKHREIALALQRLADDHSLEPIQVALHKIDQLIKDRVLYREELWREMHKAIEECKLGRHESLLQAAWQVRSRTSMVGRKIPKRTISRTLLIKGLEFDHAIVLDADALNAKELYVALTRGTRSLTVLSASPTVQKSPPFLEQPVSAKSC